MLRLFLGANEVIPAIRYTAINTIIKNPRPSKCHLKSGVIILFTISANSVSIDSAAIAIVGAIGAANTMQNKPNSGFDISKKNMGSPRIIAAPSSAEPPITPAAPHTSPAAAARARRDFPSVAFESYHSKLLCIPSALQINLTKTECLSQAVILTSQSESKTPAAAIINQIPLVFPKFIIPPIIIPALAPVIRNPIKRRLSESIFCRYMLQRRTITLLSKAALNRCPMLSLSRSSKVNGSLNNRPVTLLPRTSDEKFSRRKKLVIRLRRHAPDIPSYIFLKSQ